MSTSVWMGMSWTMRLRGSSSPTWAALKVKIWTCRSACRPAGTWRDKECECWQNGPEQVRMWKKTMKMEFVAWDIQALGCRGLVDLKRQEAVSHGTCQEVRKCEILYIFIFIYLFLNVDVNHWMTHGSHPTYDTSQKKKAGYETQGSKICLTFLFSIPFRKHT